MDVICRDHFVYAPSKWENTLQCNVVSHWLGACTEWSLHLWIMSHVLLVIARHDDFSKWKHFPHYWPFVRGIHWWIPLTKASNMEFSCFLWCLPKQTVEQTVNMLVIWDTITLMIMSLLWKCHVIIKFDMTFLQYNAVLIIEFIFMPLCIFTKTNMGLYI